MAIFVLDSIERKENAVRHIRQLPTDGKVRYCITIKPYRRNRTQQQNNLMWMWLDVIANSAGYGEEHVYVDDDGNTFFNLTGTDIIKMKLQKYFLNGQGTSTLTVEQMGEFLNNIEKLADWLGIILPQPDDKRYIMYGEKNNSYVPPVKQKKE